MRCKIIEITFFFLISLLIISFIFNIEFLRKIPLLSVGLLSTFAYLKVTKFNKNERYKHSFNILFFIVLCLMYFSDILLSILNKNMPNFPKFYVNILLYLILIYIVSKQILERGYQKMDFIIKISLIITLILFAYIFYYVNQMIKSTPMDFYNLFLFYGLILFSLSSVVIFNFTQKPNKSNINLSVAVTCIILSDVFYIINLLYLKIPLFTVIIGVTNLLTYYFLFHYEMNRNKIKLVKQ